MNTDPKQVDHVEEDWVVDLMIGAIVTVLVIVPAILSCFLKSGVDPGF